MQRKIFRVEQLFAGQRAMAARKSVAAPPASMPAADATLERELTALRDLIAHNRRELDALMLDGKERRMARASSELDAAIDGMEKATESIIKSSEIVDESARALSASLKSDYERGLAQDIQEQVVGIYEACNFQDLAGQRIGKVIATLDTVERQIAALLARDAAASPPVSAARKPGRELINGPKLDGDCGHASQHEIDRLFGVA